VPSASELTTTSFATESDPHVRPRKTLRINFVLPGYLNQPVGGYRVVFEYGNFLAARGHRVNIVFPRRIREPIPSPPSIDRIKSHLWGPKIRLLNRPLIPWHYLHPRIRSRLVADLSERSIPDADITVATAWITAPPLAQLSPRKGSKFYLIQHYEIWGGPADQVDATWRLPLKKIVISKWLEEIGHRIGATNMRHIPNGIDVERFRVTNPPHDRPMHILTLYSTSSFKGVADALAVLGTYHERYPSIPVTMFGVHERGAEIPEWITYIRNPPQDVLIEKLYNTSTVYLSASLSEGWALPPAEAMACGCAFVGTDSGGCRDFATHEVTALLCPPGDRESLLHNLIRVTDDSALRQSMQQRGTEHIQQFTWQRAGSALEAYLLE
jgi:glycosyltransferase involved in cell wall biosynthesis